jgi:TRAP-type mannitol/chloroaromatic compound transport system permease large subunit
VILSALVALGIVLLHVQKETRGFEAYLYGAVLALSDSELLALYLVGTVVFILIARWFNRLILISLNTDLAASRGIPARRTEYLFAVLLALVVTFSLRAVGLFMVTALLVIPAATARNLAGGVRGLFWIALTTALGASLSGLLLAFYLDTPAGATIILISSLLFLLSTLGVGLFISTISQTQQQAMMASFFFFMPAMLLSAPLLLPLARSFNIDMVHFGVVMTANLSIALYTPPVGGTLFVAANLAKAGIGEITRHLIPLMVATVSMLLVITYFPGLTKVVLWLLAR